LSCCRVVASSQLLMAAVQLNELENELLLSWTRLLQSCRLGPPDFL